MHPITRDLPDKIDNDVPNPGPRPLSRHGPGLVFEPPVTEVDSLPGISQGVSCSNVFIFRKLLKPYPDLEIRFFC